MKTDFELLAPGGDLDSIKAAILAGADAIYCGLDSFNARQRAANLSFDDLCGVINLAHQYRCKIFLTINIVVLEHEISALIQLLNKIINSHVDGVIVQDLGLFYLLQKYFPSLDVHASTQVTTHNEGQILFLSKLGATRVNLSRELNIEEIKALTHVGHQHNVLSEVFVHGSYCIGFSGICYISSAHGGNSGNRGRCSQPCRDQYLPTAEGREYPLNLKDNSAFSDLQALADAEVDSLKIEGRIKKANYVYTVVNRWREQIQSLAAQGRLLGDDSDLYKVFNRDFSNAYLTGVIDKKMFIDNPRDHSIQHFTKIYSSSSEAKQHLLTQSLYDEKAAMAERVEEKIKTLNIAQRALELKVSGVEGSPLKVGVRVSKGAVTSDAEDEITCFELCSKSPLSATEKSAIDRSVIDKRFKGLKGGGVVLQSLDLDGLQPGLVVPFKELTQIKNEIAYFLNGSKPLLAPVTLPAIKKAPVLPKPPRLSVLISSKKDLLLCEQSSAKIYFKLPEGLASQLPQWVALFLDNPELTPWFPSILIGEDYQAAVTLLQQVKPALIVTNNSGIAYQAYEQGIAWIAGPYLNITNSYSLVALKEQFNSSGAFISNELNKLQIKRIQRPDAFELHYSIYHPISLLTSRQCLFFQTVGCKKEQMDEFCLPKCKRATQITNLKETSFLLDKQRGGYPSLYGAEDFLNTEIVTDLAGQFTSFFIDLSDIASQTQSEFQRENSKDRVFRDKVALVRLFETLLKGKQGCDEALHQAITPSTCIQYKKGL